MDAQQKKEVEDIVDKKLLEQKNALNQDLKKFMYDKVYEELKLNREWAIKVSAFTSAVYLGVISLANSEAGREIIAAQGKLFFWVLTFFAGLGIVNICKRHLSYLECRNILIGFQNSWGIGNWELLQTPDPPTSTETVPKSGETTLETPKVNQSKLDSRSGLIFLNGWWERKTGESIKPGWSGLMKNASGLLFYGAYLFTTYAITAIIICNAPTTSAADLQSLKDIKTQDSTIRSSLINILQSKEKLSVEVDTVIIKSVPAPKSPVKKKQPVGKKRN